MNNFSEFFDARTFWPECPSIGEIYDQRKGFPSWIYATVGQIADRLCIKYGIHIDVEATVERITKANGGFNHEYNSADIGQAVVYWSKKGIFTVQPVNSPDCLVSSQECETKEVKLDKSYKVDVVNPYYLYDKMRDIMLNGPMSLQIKVYADLPSYKSGVYHRVSDKFLGTHVVKIIGWGHTSSEWYWLAINSWGPEWGNNGVFKIRLKNEQDIGLEGISLAFQSGDCITSLPKQDQLFDLA